MLRYAVTAGRAVAQVSVYVRPQLSAPGVVAEASSAAWAGLDSRRFFWSAGSGDKGDDGKGEGAGAAAADGAGGNGKDDGNVRVLHHASSLTDAHIPHCHHREATGRAANWWGRRTRLGLVTSPAWASVSAGSMLLLAAAFRWGSRFTYPHLTVAGEKAPKPPHVVALPIRRPIFPWFIAHMTTKDPVRAGDLAAVLSFPHPLLSFGRKS